MEIIISMLSFMVGYFVTYMYLLSKIDNHAALKGMIRNQFQKLKDRNKILSIR
jgi:hypothetical protein